VRGEPEEMEEVGPVNPGPKTNLEHEHTCTICHRTWKCQIKDMPLDVAFQCAIPANRNSVCDDCMSDLGSAKAEPLP